MLASILATVGFIGSFLLPIQTADSAVTRNAHVHRLDSDSITQNAAGPIRLVGHEDIVRLPPTRPSSANSCQHQEPLTNSPPPLKAPTVASDGRESIRPLALIADSTSLPANDGRALAAAPIESPSSLPIRVKTLDLDDSIESTQPADNDHARFAAENMRISPLSGVHDFEQPMDVTLLNDTEASDAPLTEEERSLLKLSPEVQAHANRMLRQAVQLADRGAVYAAKTKFLSVLRMVTQSLDAKIGRSYHSRCLARGLRALDEADDFTSQSKCVETDSDLDGFIVGHQTGVLHGADVSHLTPLIAMRHYYEYAHEQLTQAGAQSSVVSQAFFAIGRAHTLIHKTSTRGASSPKSLAYYNAALAVDPRNAQAANELAVMLAHSGHLKHAATVLERSVNVAPSSIGMQNLTQIYGQLGQQNSAQKISTSYHRLASTPGALTPTAGQVHQQIRWVSPQAFNTTASSVESDSSSNVISSHGLRSASASRQAPGPRTKLGSGKQNQWW